MDLSRRNLQLDVLRGLAILMVLACHSIFVQKPSWNAAFIRAGWSGVDLFFVVSGFLISGLLFSEYRKTGGIRFRRFAIRRAVKIYPAFYAIVVVTVAVEEYVFAVLALVGQGRQFADGQEVVGVEQEKRLLAIGE